MTTDNAQTELELALWRYLLKKYGTDPEHPKDEPTTNSSEQEVDDGRQAIVQSNQG